MISLFLPSLSSLDLFWDSPAICASLLRASGQGSHDEDANELSCAIAQTVDEVNRFKTNGKNQAAVYKLIRGRFHACDLIRKIHKRCLKYFSFDASAWVFPT